MNTVNLKWMLGLLLLTPALALAGKPVDEHWDVDANVAVTVENTAGKIVIEGWDKNEVYLTGELGNSVKELETSVSKSSVQISVDNQNWRNIDNTELRLRVPNGASISVTAVSADIDVAGLDNEKLTVSSVSGDVTVAASSQRVTIESVSGDVNFSGETTRISAESVSGDLDLSGISGEIEATTVSGEMVLQAGLIDTAKLETVSGDIRTAGELSGNGRLSAESMSGDITIMLPAEQSGLFKAESFSGRIETDFGAVEEARHGPGRHLKFVAGSSAAEVRAESFSGNIRLKNK